MFCRSLFCVAAVAATRVLAQGTAANAQIEQSRQFSRPLNFEERGSTATGTDVMPESSVHPDDAFGAQVILKSQERFRPFTGFAEASAFFTNNVALAKHNPLEDKFLVISAGAFYSRPIADAVRLDAGVRSALYRYAEYRELDFQSIDASLGVGWSPEALRGAEITARYLFTDLTTAEDLDEIYRSHAVLLGVQKVVPFSRAHAAYFGASAQWTWSDPQEPGRDEYVALAGYHLQATEHISADLSYRYGYFVYREDDGRRDHNHTISLMLRFAPVEWAAISATSYVGINRSNESAFDYEVWNTGVALQFSVQF